jgi:uncharacterized glyoxalase superfamily protein PhnB
MAKKLSALHQDLIPYLYYRDPAAAVEFLRKAFGFEVRNVHEDDSGGVMHAELGIGRSAVMLGPASEAFGFREPSQLPARHGGVWCYVDDADAHCARARAAGATIVREPTNQFYGVREYSARDLGGQEWFFATPLAGRAAAGRKKPARKGKASPKKASGKKPRARARGSARGVRRKPAGKARRR